jgi:RNA polymerase sigma factor (sigma-70 family)
MYPSHPESSVLEASTPNVQAEGREDRQSLEAHRAYLRCMANARIAPAIKFYVSPSDVVQSTFASAFRILADPESPAIRNLKHWLTGILKNKIRTARRKFLRGEHLLAGSGRIDAKVQDCPEDGPGVRPEKSVDESDTFTWAMAKLPENQRQVVELHLLHHLEMTEIANLLGITVSCATRRYQRARQFLQDRIDPSEYR